MRRGLEADFDADKMRPGEWAVSTDKKYVRMCFFPGVCVRMATYDAFEKDMAAIQDILAECQTIEQAVTLINTQISANAQAVAEYTAQAKQYRDEAKQFRDEAETSATNAKTSEDKAKVSETNAKISEENARRVAESLPEDYTELSKAFYNTAIKQKAVGDNIHVTDSASSKVVEFGLYGKATQDGEPTPDNPIEITVSGSDGSVEVVSCGKNLLKNKATSQKVNGVEFVVNEDKSITANRTATANSSIELFIEKSFDEDVIISGCPKGGSTSTYAITLKVDGAWGQAENGSGYVVPKGKVINQINLSVYSGYKAENLTFYPMIRKASDTDATYEPYKESTITVPTPNGLCGIKVSSGGNYTDENGQQWICDEIVKYADGSGKRIQRVDSVDMGTLAWEYLSPYFKANDLVGVVKEPIDNKGYSHALSTCFVVKNYDYLTENNNGLSIVYSSSASHGQIWCKATDYTDLKSFKEMINGQYLYYELAEPITTDLTAEEIAEIEKLHTFYPITNISNDAECGMEVTYIADSKNYIDGQLAIQKAQQEEALATMLLLMPEEVQASMIENDTNNLLNESEV